MELESNGKKVSKHFKLLNKIQNLLYKPRIEFMNFLYNINPPKQQ